MQLTQFLVSISSIDICTPKNIYKTIQLILQKSSYKYSKEPYSLKEPYNTINTENQEKHPYSD